LGLVSGQIFACIFDQSLVANVEDLFVLANEDAVRNCEVGGFWVVKERLVVAVTDYRFHSLEKRFACAHVPVFETRNQIQVHIRLLIDQVHCFVSSASYP